MKEEFSHLNITAAGFHSSRGECTRAKLNKSKTCFIIDNQEEESPSKMSPNTKKRY